MGKDAKKDCSAIAAGEQERLEGLFANPADAFSKLIDEVRNHPLYGLDKVMIRWTSGCMTNGIKYCTVHVACPDGEYHIEASGEEADALEIQAKRVNSEMAKYSRADLETLAQRNIPIDQSNVKPSSDGAINLK